MRNPTQNARPRSWGDRIAWVATHDHCQWANRFFHWLKTPLGVLGATAAAALACGLWVAPQGYAVLGAIAVVIAIGLVWPWVGVRGVGCELRFTASRGRAGRATGIDVSITNRWPWPVWGLAIENGFAGGSDIGAAVALARIGGWSRATFRWEFTPEVRGVYPRRAPSIVTEFPFGLWKARRPVVVTDRLVVWPDTFWLPPFPPKPGASDWIGRAHDSHSGQEGERIGVREYRAGDSLRMVHWAKSASRDRLVVSEREGSSRVAALVEVDSDPRSHAGEGPDGSREWALRIAASVCETLLAQRAAVELRLTTEGDAPVVATGDASRLMDTLATFDTDAPRPAASGRPRAHQIALRIATDRSAGLQGGEIVLRAGVFAGESEGSAGGLSEWILVDDPAGVADQVLCGWRRTGREAHRVS